MLLLKWATYSFIRIMAYTYHNPLPWYTSSKHGQTSLRTSPCVSSRIALGVWQFHHACNVIIYFVYVCQQCSASPSIWMRKCYCRCLYAIKVLMTLGSIRYDSLYLTEIDKMASNGPYTDPRNVRNAARLRATTSENAVLNNWVTINLFFCSSYLLRCECSGSLEKWGMLCFYSMS